MIEVDTNTILPHWTRLAEESLEAGQVPLLVLSSGGLSLEAMPGLMALAHMGEDRAGLARPAAAAGGDAGLWFLALLHQRRLAHAHAGGDVARRIQAIHSQVPPALFTGADMATQAAGLNLAAQSLTASPLGRRQTSLDGTPPPGLAWQILPVHRAGAANRWAWLPFETISGTPPAAQPAAHPAPDQEGEPAPLAAWTAYVGLLLALGMILATLLR